MIKFLQRLSDRIEATAHVDGPMIVIVGIDIVVCIIVVLFKLFH